MYFNTNMFACLPVPLANDGKADTLLTLTVADNVPAAAKRVKDISLRMVLSDPAAQGMPEVERLEPVVVANFARPTPDGCAHNIPVAKGIEKLIEARINNIPLGPAWVEDRWLVFPVESQQLAVGDNLVGVRVTQRSPQIYEEILIEKLELYVEYC